MLFFNWKPLNSAEKRQISETAVFSADYLWDFNLRNYQKHLIIFVNILKNISIAVIFSIDW